MRNRNDKKGFFQHFTPQFAERDSQLILYFSVISRQTRRAGPLSSSMAANSVLSVVNFK